MFCIISQIRRVCLQMKYADFPWKEEPGLALAKG